MIQDAFKPVDDFDTVKENLSLTTEAVKIFAVSAPPLCGFCDVSETFNKIKINSVADSEELLDVISMMYTMRQVKIFFRETHDGN